MTHKVKLKLTTTLYTETPSMSEAVRRFQATNFGSNTLGNNVEKIISKTPKTDVKKNIEKYRQTIEFVLEMKIWDAKDQKQAEKMAEDTWIIIFDVYAHNTLEPYNTTMKAIK